MNKYDGTPVKHVSRGNKSLDRDSITIGASDIPVRFYRTNAPTIFAGFQINWLEGTDPETGAEIDLSSGAGMGSKYMTLCVKLSGQETVYEYVDMSEVLNARAAAIIAELTARGVTRKEGAD